MAQKQKKVAQTPFSMAKGTSSKSSYSNVNSSGSKSDEDADDDSVKEIKELGGRGHGSVTISDPKTPLHKGSDPLLDDVDRVLNNNLILQPPYAQQSLTKQIECFTSRVVDAPSNLI